MEAFEGRHGKFLFVFEAGRILQWSRGVRLRPQMSGNINEKNTRGILRKN
jgi:hypothetical protein